MNKITNLENSYYSSISESSETSNKKKQKYYYLYKVGGKYLLKKKGKENVKKKSSTKIRNEKVNIKLIESHINSLFRYKYTKLRPYNTIIINRLIYNANSSIVTSFKENLILCDYNEYFFRFYGIKKGMQLLKKILDYYETNNIIYPNYTALYEGNYIFNNIEQKQKIIDRIEQKAKNKKEKKQEEEKNKEENILSSNVVESILNQTNTSENKRLFGLKDDINNSSNNNLIEEDNDDYEQINSLIKNIDKLEKNENKNKIFKKKNLIRIINDKINKLVKKENSVKKDNMRNNKNLNLKDLLSTISYFHKHNSKFKMKDFSIKDNLNNNNNEHFYNTHYNKLLINKKNIINSLKEHKRINTLDVDKIRPKNIIISNNKKYYNNSQKNSKSPYIFRKPISNIDNITYSKKKILQNFTGRNTTRIHKNSKSINTVSNSNFHLDSDYFNIDNNNFKKIKVYRKKLHKIDTDFYIENRLNYINSNITTQNSESSRKKNHIRVKPRISDKQLNIPVRIYTSSNKNTILDLYDSKNKYKRVSPIPQFKTISKIIKAKILIDEKLNKKLNSTPLTTRNTLNNFNHNKIKINLTGKDENIKNYTTKNIYISNNITNNNFYTINNNGAKKNVKLLIHRNKKNKNNEIIKRNTEKLNIKLNIKEYNLSKYENLYTNTEKGGQKMHKYNKSNNFKIDKGISYSQNNKKKSIINPYKNGLLNSTTLKSLDKNSLHSLLNKLKKESSSNEKKLSFSNNNIKYKSINEMKPSNNIGNTKFFV